MALDSQWYLQQNPDVAAAKAAAGNTDGYAQMHYDNYGRNEGRDHAPTLSEVITGIYNQAGRVSRTNTPLGQTRVMTASGKFYDVAQDPNTANLTYTPYSGVNDYKPAMSTDNLGLYNTPAQTASFGNRYNNQSINVGGSFDYKPPAPTEFPSYVPADQRQAIFTPQIQGVTEQSPNATTVAPLSLTAARNGQSAGDAGVQLYGGSGVNRVIG